ncbi:Uncharacterised protein [Mycobacteroides abscessus subsp. abscessus]|nr:Uncharacterised protein [Mycobacteroides abscessus subsp. abscessus]
MYATGARLIAVPGWPLPTFCTASAASTRTVSTARESSSVQSSGWSARVRVGISVGISASSREIAVTGPIVVLTISCRCLKAGSRRASNVIVQ